MPYWRAYYHVIWATRGRADIIRPELEDPIGRIIRSVALEHKAMEHAVGFMPDHVHVVASIPPSVTVSTLVGKMKGSSSHLINSRYLISADERFSWQAEFGMLTFAESHLSTVI